MRKPSARLEYSAHRFVVRRIESALLCGDADPAQRPARGRALLAGCLLAAVVLAASAMLGVLRPQAGLGNAPIMVAQPSGALYVRVGDTVHPVLNLASARLIARTAANPSPVRKRRSPEPNAVRCWGFRAPRRKSASRCPPTSQPGHCATAPKSPR